jgi:predicted ArsR family transcriptional regulator
MSRPHWVTPPIEEDLPLFAAPAQKHSATSMAAAESQTAARAGGDRAAIFSLLESDGPLTDEAIGERLAIAANTVRPRRVELVRAGLVVAVDDNGLTRACRRATRWGVATAGR